MLRYVKLYNQFCEFVMSAANSMRDPYEMKLVNVILDFFDEIAGAGTGHGCANHQFMAPA